MSKLALKLIAENKKTRSTFLDLGNCGLTEVPEEIGELVWLEGLLFTGVWTVNDNKTLISNNSGPQNKLFRLAPATYCQSNPESSPFFRLVNLRWLCLSDRFFEPMTFSDLSPLSGLKNLRTLYVPNAPVTDLTPLSDLKNLLWLDISNTQVTDLTPLADSKNLQMLFASNTKVTDLKPLSDFVNLERLEVSNTSVKDVRPLSGLANLQALDITETQVNDLSPLLGLISEGLPVEMGQQIWWTNGIFVSNCPMTNPPMEIVNQGNAAILNYFHEQAIQGTDHLHEAKMLIIGEGGSGKTSLLRRLYQTEKSLPDENETTKGIDIYCHEFKLDNGRTFRLNVWDFGGQEIYHATHQFFLTKRSLYVLLDDTRKDYKTVHDPGFKYWLEVADLLGDHSPVLIFQTEKGGRSKAIDVSGIKAKFNNVKDVYRGNLELTGSADGLRKAVEFHAQNLPHIGEELPKKWLLIRADIERQAKDKPYISQQDYFGIYKKHLDFDRDKALLLSRYLHDLGVFLHFQDEPLLARTVILQNTWATEAVFRMLDDETVKKNLGHFDSKDCQRVWQDSMYADMHPELLALMQKFELCYRLPDSAQDAWLAPQLLPPSKPENLADWQQPDDLTLRYRYEFLPKGIVSRLIVRMHRFVKRPELSWVFGALFERGGSEVLAEVPAKGGEIVLHARGYERKELLSVIAADLDALNDSFHGLKDLVSKWVPCNCNRCSKLTEPEFFEQKRLLQRKQDGKLKVECPASYEDVDVLELLDGIRVDKLPGWAKEDKDFNPMSIKSQEPLHTIKIFLASSSELKEDRDEFDLYFRQQNDRLLEQGIYLKIVRWENFLDAMSETRLQDEYNKKVKACDIFVSLFFSKTGKFTEEEFDTAHRQFLETKKPLIYTFFKNAPLNSGEINDEILSLLNFKKKLKELGHFYTGYDNIEHLKRQFKDQLEKLRENGI
jgi:internalin A